MNDAYADLNALEALRLAKLNASVLRALIMYLNETRGIFASPDTKLVQLLKEIEHNTEPTNTEEP